MFDHRKIKKIDLDDSICLKYQNTYQINDSITGKKLVAKLIAYYNDKDDIYLITEFRKLALLSSEPEIGTVYYLATAIIKGEEKSCYLMDFMDGYTLEEFLAKNEHLSFKICVK